MVILQYTPISDLILCAVIIKTFQLLWPQAFFGCLSLSAAILGFQTEPFIQYSFTDNISYQLLLCSPILWYIMFNLLCKVNVNLPPDFIGVQAFLVIVL